MALPTVQLKRLVPDNEYEILRFQKDVGEEIIANIRDILQDEDINFTGDLSTSFSLVLMYGKAWVETDNKYAHLVDKGLKPGTYVNYDAIKDWVKIKLGFEEPELTEVTWKIVRKIRTVGIPPKRYIKKALKGVISTHGALSAPSRRSKRSSGSKTLNKINKMIRKISKIVKKASRTLNKGFRMTRRYK